MNNDVNKVDNDVEGEEREIGYTISAGKTSL